MWLVILVPIALILASVVLPAFWGGAWSPTPMRIVNQMLSMAQLKKGETLYDLGAGDGRVITTAVRKHPVKAVGVEIDPLKCLLLRIRLRLMNLKGAARVLQADFFKVDLSKADVVFLYLSPIAHDRLGEKLRAELKPGARVVSYRRTIADWQPVTFLESEGLYLYKVQERRTSCKDSA